MNDAHTPVFLAVRQLAASVFGAVAQADDWLHTPNAVLDGQPPAAAIQTATGHRAVVAELKRIEYSRG